MVMTYCSTVTVVLVVLKVVKLVVYDIVRLLIVYYKDASLACIALSSSESSSAASPFSTSASCHTYTVVYGV